MEEVKEETQEEYKYTKDWFHWAPDVWLQLVPMMPGRKRFLELGSFEGRSTVWTIENMMEDGGEIVCIDTWEGGEEHILAQNANDTVERFDTAEKNFDDNIEVIKKKFPLRNVRKRKGETYGQLGLMVEEERLMYPFDFIYIDASHIAKDVMTDACLAWPMLKPGGIMVFDDYMWGDPRDLLHRPKMAVDCFVDMFAEELDVRHMAYQFIVQKKVEETK